MSSARYLAAELLCKTFRNGGYSNIQLGSALGSADMDERDKKFEITKLSEGVFRVTGKQVERMVIQTDWENDEAITFLQHRFKRLKLDEALEKAGARDGDEIRILECAFEFESAHMHEDVFGGLDI